MESRSEQEHRSRQAGRKLLAGMIFGQAVGAAIGLLVGNPGKGLLVGNSIGLGVGGLLVLLVRANTRRC